MFGQNWSHVAPVVDVAVQALDVALDI